MLAITSTNALPLDGKNRFGAKDDVPSVTDEAAAVTRVEEAALAPAEPAVAHAPNLPVEETEFSSAVPWDSPPPAPAVNAPVEWNNVEPAASEAGETSEPGEIYEPAPAPRQGGWGSWEPAGGKGAPGVSAGW